MASYLQFAERSERLKSLGILDIARYLGKYSHLSEEDFQSFIQRCFQEKEATDKESRSTKKQPQKHNLNPLSTPLSADSSVKTPRVKSHGGKREHAGRKPGPTTKAHLHVCISPELLEYVGLYARARGCSRSRAVEELLGLALSHPSMRTHGCYRERMPSNRSTLPQDELARVALP